MAPLVNRPWLAFSKVHLCCRSTVLPHYRVHPKRPKGYHTRSRIGRGNLRDRKCQAHRPNTGYQPAPHSRRGTASVQRIRVGSHDGAIKSRDRQREAERGPQSELALEDLVLSTGARVVRPDAQLNASRSWMARGDVLTGL